MTANILIHCDDRIRSVTIFGTISYVSYTNNVFIFYQFINLHIICVLLRP